MNTPLPPQPWAVFADDSDSSACDNPAEEVGAAVVLATPALGLSASAVPAAVPATVLKTSLSSREVSSHCKCCGKSGVNRRTCGKYPWHPCPEGTLCQTLFSIPKAMKELRNHISEFGLASMRVWQRKDSDVIEKFLGKIAMLKAHIKNSLARNREVGRLCVKVEAEPLDFMFAVQLMGTRNKLRIHRRKALYRIEHLAQLNILFGSFWGTNVFPGMVACDAVRVIANAKQPVFFGFGVDIIAWKKLSGQHGALELAGGTGNVLEPRHVHGAEVVKTESSYMFLKGLYIRNK